jgi:hypothetical protein
MRKNVLLLFFGFIFCALNAQNQSLYPDNFLNSSTVKTWVNPSLIVSDSVDYEVNLASKNRINTLGNVAINQLDAGLFFGKLKYNQQLKVLLLNEKEGPYISRPRAYFNYAIRLPINKETELALGTSFGFASSFIDASAISSNSNFLAPDASLGISMRHNNLELGLSSMQFLNNTITSEVYAQKLRRYYHLHSSYTFVLQNNYALKVLGLYRYYSDLANQYNLGLVVQKRELFEAGALYQNINGFSAFAQYSFVFDKQKINCGLTYNTGLFSVSRTVNQGFELAINFLF